MGLMDDGFKFSRFYGLVGSNFLGIMDLWLQILLGLWFEFPFDLMFLDVLWWGWSLVIDEARTCLDEVEILQLMEHLQKSVAQLEIGQQA